MHIDSQGPFSTGPLPPRQRPALVASGPAAPGTQAGACQAARGLSAPLSTTAAARLAGADADFDAARVAEIRASIREGRYTVDTTRIADSLIASARELLQPPRP